ncbi:MAG: tetraacyldisaccharide 4'-kinase [Legionellaceae bacterium]|nr:tetraacyldisaccharide 4'-kinase [Legionellaceae bacterium]
MIAWFNKLWYKPVWWGFLLFPLSLPWQVVSGARRHYLRRFRQKTFSLPIIVVGNISSGGVGKTPLVIALLDYLQHKGYRVGVVSRGYKARTKIFPHLLSPEDRAEDVGDEPLLIARKTGCPVAIAPNRVAAVECLLAHHDLDIIISDDGLQHYALGRSIEIAVIDGQRQLGNGLCLPAGPLRERAHRLREVDLLVVNSGTWPGAHLMQCQPVVLRQVRSGKRVALESLALPILALSGIGNPARFYQSLQSMGCVFEKKEYPDHYAFSRADFPPFQGSIIMTEKDAIKCQDFAPDNCYSLVIEAQLTEHFWNTLDKKLETSGLL